MTTHDTTTRAPTAEQVRAAWDALAAGFDRYVTPETVALAEATLPLLDIRPGTRLLDVAAGTGSLSMPAARLGASVVATDLSPAMIDALAVRVREIGPGAVECRVMDGTALELEDDTFDVAASVNGVSLFPDITTGLAEMTRVTRPAGRIAVVSFGPPPTVEFLAFCMGAMKATVPGFQGFPTTPPPLPFQVCAPEAMRARLVEAGLQEVTVHTRTCDMHFESAGHLWSAFRASNPIAATFTDALSHEQEEQVTQVLHGMLQERAAGDSAAVLHAGITVGIGTVPQVDHRPR